MAGIASHIHFRGLYHYTQCLHNWFYYRHRRFVNRQLVPAPGTPVLVVANHQNALGDPLALEFAFSDRRLSIFARADIFQKKFLNFFFRAIYVLPSYRMRTDGEASVSKNFSVFNEAAQRLLDGGTLAIFPEGTNQPGHWLGEFSLAYLRLAFEAAELSGWQKDIQILPVGLHYESYFRFHTDQLVSFGQPISLQPYYERYQTKPRTVQREVDALVCERLKALMLHIDTETDREAVELLREGIGRAVSEIRAGGRQRLDAQLQSDRHLVERMENLQQTDPKQWKLLRDEVTDVEQEIRSWGMRHWLFYRPWRLWRLLQEILLLLIASPLAAVGFAAVGPIVLAMRPLIRKFRQMGGPFPLFQSGVQFIGLMVLPLWFVLIGLLVGALSLWWAGLAVALLLPLAGMCAWRWSVGLKKTLGMCRYRRLMRDEEGTALAERWRMLYKKLKTLI